jgi:hypothetical protein
MSRITPYRASSTQAYSPPYNTYYPVEYFSGVDISFFFGNNYIDEIVSFECEVQEKVMPVYGYASYTPDRIVQGSRIVRGSFCINLRPGDYFHELLWQTSNFQNSQQSSSFQVPSNSAQNPPAVQNNAAAYSAWKANNKSAIWGSQQAPNPQEGDLATAPYFINGGFQILLVYGDVDTIDMTQRNIGKIRSIDNVYVFCNNQFISPRGDNIIENFRFIATDMNGLQRGPGL